MNNTIRLANAPRRIISLVPSQTELLYHLGLEEEVVGITKFCIHPEKWFRNKTRVGGTKNVNFEKIRALNPDLIIANKEENAQEDIETLQKEFPVYISDIYSFEDALDMIHGVGILTKKEEIADQWKDKVKKSISNLPQIHGRVLYFIWADPFMVVGPNTFIGHVLERNGLTNVLSNRESRYEEVTLKEVLEYNPDYLFLSSEPFPFAEKHKQLFPEELQDRVVLVDGEICSWYGSRMVEMSTYFHKLQNNLNKKPSSSSHSKKD